MTEDKLLEILAKLVVILNKNEVLSDVSDVFEEMFRYKNIEEELGTDLPTLFKALADGFYFINRRGSICDTRCYLKPVFDAYRQVIEIQEYIDTSYGCWYKNTGEYVKLCDYGKKQSGGWALTKEELK